MTIRFAAAISAENANAHLPVCKPIARALISRAMERVSNDNGPSASDTDLNDHVLKAALRHFAQHGLGAARLAKAQAQAAGAAQDRQSFEWWLGITRTLARRMAAEVESLVPSLA